MKKIMFIYGTRPEAIKMAPLIKEFSKDKMNFSVIVCLTGQHREMLDQINLFFIEPLDYPYLLWIMEKSFLVLTDSGGIQEEAPALGKPVLVMRDVTERQEGVEAGTAKLVGTDFNVIVSSVNDLLDNPLEYKKMSNAINPYGNGTTSKKIMEIILKDFK